jgi:hypothetical protein
MTRRRGLALRLFEGSTGHAAQDSGTPMRAAHHILTTDCARSMIEPQPSVMKNKRQKDRKGLQTGYRSGAFQATAVAKGRRQRAIV